MATIHFISGSPNAKKHIVFIHGLRGHYLSTWQSSDTDKTFWPKWLCEDVVDVSIWSVEYDASMLSMKNAGMGLEDRAQNIYEGFLAESRLSSGELILVGHSFGGLIIKQMLRLASDEIKRPEAVAFINRVTVLAFLGVPHTGSDIATIGDSFLVRLVLKLPLFLQPSAIFACLVRNNPQLRALNTWHRRWCQDKTIRHLSLIESKTTIYFMIVKPDSADPGLSQSGRLTKRTKDI